MRRWGPRVAGVWVSAALFVACGDSGGDAGSGGAAGTGGAGGGSAGATSGGAAGAGGLVEDAAPDSSASDGSAADATQDAKTSDADDASAADGPSDAPVCLVLTCAKDSDCEQGCGPCLIVGSVGYCTGYSNDS